MGCAAKRSVSHKVFAAFLQEKQRAEAKRPPPKIIFQKNSAHLRAGGNLSSIISRFRRSSPLLGGTAEMSMPLTSSPIIFRGGRLTMATRVCHQLLGLIIHGDAGENLPVGAGAVVQGEAQQLVGLLHRLAVLDLDGPKSLLQKVSKSTFSVSWAPPPGREGGLLGLSGLVQLLQGLGGIDAGNRLSPRPR